MRDIGDELAELSEHVDGLGELYAQMLPGEELAISQLLALRLKGVLAKGRSIYAMLTGEIGSEIQ